MAVGTNGEQATGILNLAYRPNDRLNVRAGWTGYYEPSEKLQTDAGTVAVPSLRNNVVHVGASFWKPLTVNGIYIDADLYRSTTAGASSGEAIDIDVDRHGCCYHDNHGWGVAAAVATTAALVMGDALAISLLAWGIYESRAQVLEQQFGEVSWETIHDAAMAPGGWAELGGQGDWGYFKLAISNPRKNISGLAAMVAAAGEYYDRTNISVEDVTNPEFQEWLREIMSSMSENPF